VFIIVCLYGAFVERGCCWCKRIKVIKKKNHCPGNPTSEWIIVYFVLCFFDGAQDDAISDGFCVVYFCVGNAQSGKESI
jgi:hypothetical protein